MRRYGRLAPDAMGHFFRLIPLQFWRYRLPALGASWRWILLPKELAGERPLPSLGSESISGHRTLELRFPLASLWPAMSRDDGHELRGGCSRRLPFVLAAHTRNVPSL